MIRLLQFSDIHFLYCDETEDEYSQMRQRFKEDLTNLKRRVGAIPYVLICGDIANKGQKQEFNKARGFIKEICEILKVDEKQPDVYVVPGNHDVNRKSYEETRMLLRQKLLKFENQENERFMETIRHNETDSLKILYSSLSEYNDFATEFSSVDFFSEALMEGGTSLNQSNTNIFWKRTIGKLENYTVNIIGLNSTLLCDGKEKNKPDVAKGEHTLFLPFMAYNIVSPSNEVNISMIHHPLDWLGNENRVQQVFDERFKVQFYGHMHKQSSGSDASVKIYSGALQPPSGEEDYPSVYNYIEIDIKDSQLLVKLICRKWTGDSFVEYLDESRQFVLSLRRADEWSQKEKNASANATLAEVTPIPKHEIIYTFRSLPSDEKQRIMRLLDSPIDALDLSSHEKELMFIRKMRDSNRLTQLYNELQKKQRNG